MGKASPNASVPHRVTKTSGGLSVEHAFFAWDQMEWETVDDLTARKVVHLGRVMCVLFRLSEGSDAPPHSHPHEQLATVLKGRIIAQIGEESKTIGPMDGYRVPPDVPHKVTVLEDALILDCFSPIREDFLGG